MSTEPYFLLSHPNPHGPHFYESRRSPVLAVVVHITAGLEDLDLTGPDDSAEATARYAATTTRKVSWHTASDSDTYLRLLPTTYTAFHVQRYNSVTVGHEISKRDTSWADEPPAWVNATLLNAAVCLREVVGLHDIPVRHATKAELDDALADVAAGRPARPVGLIGHDVLDPARRTDPGRDFPWQRLLTLMEDDMALTKAQADQLADVFTTARNIGAEVRAARATLAEMRTHIASMQIGAVDPAEVARLVAAALAADEMFVNAFAAELGRRLGRDV